ncbi:glutaredoxin family protein [Demequina phytophila]|uniref:glutaredoxin family protein n=1 Tax=Demequina phytophila TaxID=1638981 RepID=UPI000785FC57|nr:glutaredoxin family protein [Demequina phytophila]
MPARVTLYTREGCHLCVDARSIVHQVCAEAGEEWVEVDIDSDPGLRARYTDDIPVATVDGQTVGFWRIDPERLRKALA